MSSNLPDILDFLRDGKQRVVFDYQKSTWENANASVSQGSFLGPLLFLNYINNLSGDFADDTSLFNVAHDIAQFELRPLFKGGIELTKNPKKGGDGKDC